MKKIHHEDLELQMPGSELPAEFLAGYEPLKCFSHSAISETYLVKSRENGKEYIAKIYDRFFIEGSADERVILERLNHPALPKLIGSVETENAVCVIRDYAEGVCLDTLAVPVGERAALNIGTQLCDIMTYLHGLSPPVIHRDIKPSNVIIGSDNRIRLIDFDISRQYDDKAVKDTTLIATDGFSPPEQYGYKQTDALADIYSFGRLMCWLLTGSNNAEEAGGMKNRVLARVIQKCAAFAPENRYQTADAAKAALTRACNGGKRWKVPAMAAAAVCLLAVGFAFGRIIPPVPAPPPVSEGYTFIEPLIEQAARLMLGKGEDEPIAYAELEAITEIIIIGATPHHTNDWSWLDDGKRGNINSLEDLRFMPNLEGLRLHNQPLSDISPLADNLQLGSLALMSCDVSDFSVLAGLPRLSSVNLHDTLISEYSVFEKIERLGTLAVGYDVKIKSISELGDMSGLHSLGLHGRAIQNLDGIEDMPRLNQLHIQMTSVRDFSLINDLPQIKELAVSPYMAPYLDTLDRDDIKVLSGD